MLLDHSVYPAAAIQTRERMPVFEFTTGVWILYSLSLYDGPVLEPMAGAEESNQTKKMGGRNLISTSQQEEEHLLITRPTKKKSYIDSRF